MKKKRSVIAPAKKAASKNAAVASRPSHSFPVVAIGASAGGLEAMTQLIKHLPSDTGMAFIYVQHLSPDHESMLADLLSKNSKMPVQDAKNMTAIEPNRVYVMPADKEMNMVDGKIKLSPRPRGRGVNMLIDVFFTSLAAKHRENVIGVILSGSANDGTRGMKAIKFEGGVTFAQDETAKFNSMPKSAIAAGVVDFVMPPELIATELIRLSKHPFIKSIGSKKTKEEEVDIDSADFKSVLSLMHKTFGVNFALYKMSTIRRRIMRRMLLYKIKTLKEYSALLNEKKGETDILFNDLLINVTSFFRDAEACRYLKTTLFPKLLKAKTTGESLRIWVTACSSGEEAYSIAMMLRSLRVPFLAE